MPRPAGKTHAMRVLDSRGIPYEAVRYDTRGEFHSGEEAAGLLGLPPEVIYKTLVVLGESDPGRRPLIVMIPSNAQLDLKRLAGVTGDKKLRMASQREAEKLTGMRVGGISALGLQRPGSFEVLIDARAEAREVIHVSAGERGIDIGLSPGDLARITTARFVALA